jgi:quercetin dioxygenase-like cupin family protein
VQDIPLAVHLVRPDQGIVGPLRILAGAAQTDGRYFALEWETTPSPPAPHSFHVHEVEAESEYVLTGEREISCEDETWHGGRGLFVVVPPRARHTMRTLGEAPSRWLHFFSPAGLERFFEARERMRSAGKSDAEIGRLAERHGITSVGSRAPERAPFLSRPSERDAARSVVVSGEETDGAYALLETSGLPEEPHIHAEHEAVYVMEGEVVVECEGERIAAPARSFLVVPGGVTRRHIARGPSRYLVVFSPGSVGH